MERESKKHEMMEMSKVVSPKAMKASRMRAVMKRKMKKGC